MTAMKPSEFYAVRSRLGLTQQQVADAIGKSLRSVRNYESVGPVPQSVAILMTMLNVMRKPEKRE